jgi:predicted small metal-binding protein
MRRGNTMAEHKHSVTCPACGGAISATTQDELIRLVQDHAKKDHQMDLSPEKVLEMEKAQAVK